MKVLGDEIIVACPFCGDKSGSHHKHFYINTRRGLYHCWLCGAKGTIDYLCKVEPRLCRLLESKGLIVSVVQELQRKKISKKEIILNELEKVSLTTLHKGGGLERAYEYLKKRGMTEEEIEWWNARWSWRKPEYVLFLCVEGREVVHYIGRRVRGGGKVKWWLPSKQEAAEQGLLPKGEVVFAIDKVKRGSYVIITEGIFDAIALNGVALLGKHASEKQLKKILSLNPKEVIIALDRDAVQEAMKIHKKLKWCVKTRIAFPPEGYKDWGDVMRNDRWLLDEIRRSL